jgi:hypothetical protein
MPSSHSCLRSRSRSARTSAAALSFSSVLSARLSERWTNESPVLYLRQSGSRCAEIRHQRRNFKRGGGILLLEACRRHAQHGLVLVG